MSNTIFTTNGRTGVTEALVVVDAPQVMHNLTIARVATYVVGSGQGVVHNTSCPITQLPQNSVWEEKAKQIRERYNLNNLVRDPVEKLLEVKILHYLIIKLMVCT